MLDKEDLQAIQAIIEAMEQRIDQRMDQKLEAMEERTGRELKAMEQRIMKGAATLMDAEFTQHFELLSEQQESALAHTVTDDDLDIMDGRIETLEKVVRKHSKEISELKKAN